MSLTIQTNDPIANSPCPLSAFTIEGDNLKAMVEREPVMRDIIDAKEASQALAIMFKAASLLRRDTNDFKGLCVYRKIISHPLFH